MVYDTEANSPYQSVMLKKINIIHTISPQKAGFYQF